MSILKAYTPRFKYWIPFFSRMYDWIVDAINDAKQEAQDIVIEEIELSLPPSIWVSSFSGMWAYGIHLRLEESNTSKENCDCIVSAKFNHDTEKNFCFGFIQEIVQVSYGETSPILVKCKWINPSTIQHDEYGLVCANTCQILLKTNKPYVSHITRTTPILEL